MSRSNPFVITNVPLPEEVPMERRTYIGYGLDKDSITIERQSYLDTDWLYTGSPAALDDGGDNHFTRYDLDWDVDEGETT